jgi:hypothetical protein
MDESVSGIPACGVETLELEFACCSLKTDVARNALTWRPQSVYNSVNFMTFSCLSIPCSTPLLTFIPLVLVCFRGCESH